MVVNYQNGKIYMIESLIGNCRYYGSTTQTLAQRLGKHKQDMKSKNITSKQVLKYEDFRILLVKKFPCNSIEELEAEEAVYIRNNDCVNKNIPQRTPKIYYQDNKDEISQKAKVNYEENKDEILEKNKQYYEENKDKILERHKGYYEENKDEILEKNKQYYEENKDKISGRRKEKVICECGCEVRVSYLTRHRETQKHLKLLEKNKNEENDKVLDSL